jgi:hypothetical protein
MARGGYRPNSGKPKKTATKRQATDAAKVPADIKAEAKAAKMTPLEYMIRVMNDDTVDDARRDRMAIAAAPFVHSRKGEGAGKKDERASRAKDAASGKFSPAAPPVKVVK